MQHILAPFLNRPLAIDRAALDTVIAAASMSGAPPVEALERRRAEVSADGTVGVLPVFGMISYRETGLGWLFGAESAIVRLREQLQEFRDDRRIENIVIVFDSPGGTVDGLVEFAHELRETRKVKPITALIDTMACSAAYWLACQATEIVVTPSAQVGSVGVYVLHMNHAKMLSIVGIEPTFVQAGTYKTDANPFEPLSESAQQDLQGVVNRVHGHFVDDIVRGRGRKLTAARVREHFGQGRVVPAVDALRLEMVDRLFATTAPAFAYASRAKHLQAAADHALIDSVGLALNGVEVSVEQLQQRQRDLDEINVARALTV